MKNLDYSTEILLKHYNIGTNNANIVSIKKYNNHKIRHSIGVLEYGRLILNNLDIDIIKSYKDESELCFLLHDLGRFYQNDGKEVLSNNIFEHGDAGYHIAKKEGYSESICLAIKYHNKLSISKLKNDKSFIKFTLEEKNKTEFLVKITRDADKLENMIYSIYNIEHLFSITGIKIDVFDITKECIDDILEKKLVDKKNLKTPIDNVLILMSWIFDLNFNATKKILLDNDFLGKIRNKLKEVLPKRNFKELEDVFKVCELGLKNNY